MLIDIADKLLTKVCNRNGNTVIFFHEGTFLSCAVPRYRDTIHPNRIVGIYNNMASVEMILVDLEHYMGAKHECTE